MTRSESWKKKFVKFRRQMNILVRQSRQSSVV